MSQAAHQLRGSRWGLIAGALRSLADAILGRESATAVERYDHSISFAEVVWSHFERQKEVEANIQNGPTEGENRRRQKLIKAEHGEIIESYWCRYEASGVALTERQTPRQPSNLFRRDFVIRLHAATDWRTESAPEVASSIHRWETAGIKAGEVLRETSERIALSRIFAAITRLLAFVDREPGAKPVPGTTLAGVLKEQKAELAEVNEYYQRAGENSARIVYFRGMLWGTAWLAVLIGGSFLLAWWIGWLDARDKPTYTLFVTLSMGAAGAILSVMTRMARRNGFNLEFEVGRKSMRRLGGLRPWIGAMFALAVYLALKSHLVELLQDQQHGIYFYSTVGFLSGFSERHAKVLLDSAGGGAFSSETARAGGAGAGGGDVGP
jgi:hypothetical protein